MRKQLSEIRWLRVIGLLLAAGLICLACRFLWDWLLTQIPEHPGLIRVGVMTAFAFAIVYLAMKPLAREFGYHDPRK